MNNEKVKEIKEALEQNSGYIPFINEYEVWDEVSYADILTLINELESENKSLETLCDKTYEDLTKEIDRLESELKKSMILCDGTNLDYTQDDIEMEKACEECIEEHLKQFVERLKGEMPCKRIWNKIDETLKEFIDDGARH